MPAKKVKVALAGLGFMGTMHLRVYSRLNNVNITAVCGKSHLPENGVLRAVAGNIEGTADIPLGKNVRVYRDFDEMLTNPDIDLVDICTPTALHAGQVVAALKAGKHVLCEKPLAGDVAGAQKIVRAAAGSRAFLMPGMCMRFWPGWSWLKEVVTKKTYGLVRAADFRRLTARPAWGHAATHLGGALLDLHIHDTDFVNFLFGRPEAVFSTGVTSGQGAIDHVVTQYIYQDGPAVSAEGSWLWPDGFNMSFNLNCDRATIEFDLSRGDGALRVREAGKKARTLKLKKTDGYQEEIAYFVNCVARGIKPSFVTAKDGLTALEICAAEEKSVRTRSIVKL
jgi:predicted dehydrogenase